MKILHIPHAYHPVNGGTEGYCQKLSEALRDAGHDVRVLTTDVSGVQGYYTWDACAIRPARDVVNGIAVRRLPYAGDLFRLGAFLAASRVPWLSARLSSRVRRLLDARLWGGMRSAIEQEAADVVLTAPHLVKNVQAVLDAKKRIGFALVMVPMLHEEDPNWDRNAMREALRSAQAVIALTPAEAQRLVSDYGVPRESVFTSFVGIDVPPQQRASRRPQVLFLGRKVGSKGVGDLIAAMEQVWQTLPEAELVLAGSRTGETAAIDARIRELPAERQRRVRNLDFISEAQKAELLAGSACLVLPSKVESFGVVVLEAWAHGLATITWDLPVFRSIVAHGRTGLLVDPSAGPGGLAQAITRLLSDGDFAQTLGRAGRDEALHRYAWPAVAQTVLQAYRHAVSKGPRGHRET